MSKNKEIKSCKSCNRFDCLDSELRCINCDDNRCNWQPKPSKPKKRKGIEVKIYHYKNAPNKYAITWDTEKHSKTVLPQGTSKKFYLIEGEESK